MATYNVNRAKHATTAGGVVDTINFAYHGAVLRVANRSTTKHLFFRIDGTDPTDLGDDAYYVEHSTSVTISDSKVSQVKIVTDGNNVDYSVELY